MAAAGGIPRRMRHSAAFSILRQKALRSSCETTMVGYWHPGDGSPRPPLAEFAAKTGSGPSGLQDDEPLLAYTYIPRTVGARPVVSMRPIGKSPQAEGIVSRAASDEFAHDTILRHPRDI